MPDLAEIAEILEEIGVKLIRLCVDCDQHHDCPGWGDRRCPHTDEIVLSAD